MDGGGFRCWSSGTVIAVENGQLAPLVPTPVPPTFTPAPPTFTPTPSATHITPIPTTVTPTPCPALSVAVEAERVSYSGVEISWTASGGCAPVSGTLVGSTEKEPGFFSTAISGRSGTVANSPPAEALECYTNDVTYTVTLSGGRGQQVSASDVVAVEKLC